MIFAPIIRTLNACGQFNIYIYIYIYKIQHTYIYIYIYIYIWWYEQIVTYIDLSFLLRITTILVNIKNALQSAMLTLC